MVADELRRQADQFIDIADLEDEVCREAADRGSRDTSDRRSRYEDDYDLADADDLSET
jgi:hypothetical protein